jgi:PAS domain S-box-containing protein
MTSHLQRTFTSRRGEDSFRAVFEQAAVGVAQIETKTSRFVMVNQRYCDVVGYPAEELIGLTTQAISYPDDIPANERYLAQLKAGAIREFSMEHRYYRKDGSVVWVELTVSAMWEPGEEPDYHIAVIVDLTKRKKAEDELRKFSRAVEQSLSSILITDSQGNIEFVNPAFTRLSGYTAAEALGKNPNLVKSGATPAEQYQQMWQTITAGSEWQGQFQNRRKDGGYYWVSSSISAIKNTDGVITHYVAIEDDITELKRVEGALARQNEYLSALHDVALGVLGRLNLDDLLQSLIFRACQLLNTEHGFIYLVDPGSDDLVCRFGTGAFASLVGVRLGPDEGLAGKVRQSGRPIVVDDYRSWAGRSSQIPISSVRAIVGLPLSSGSRVFGVMVIGHDSDSEARFGDDEILLLERLAHLASIGIENARLFEETQRLFRAEQQRAAELAIIVSVSEAMEQNVEVSALSRIVGDKIVEIFKADAAAILLLDAQTNTIYPLYEFDEGQYVENVRPFPLGQGLTSWILGTRRALLLGTAEEAARYGVYYPPESQAIHPLVTQSYLGVPILVGERILGVLAVHSYSRFAFDRNSVRLLSTLATSIGSALEKARLFGEMQKAREEAEAANAAKSGFLANISHELRTPLNAILGFAHLLRQDSSLTVEQRDYLEIINRSGANLLSMINDVLEISKIESGRATLREGDFDLHSLLTSIREMFSLRAEEKGLTLRCDHLGEVPRYVRADEGKLRHVLNNLLANAVKFTQRGGVILRVCPLDRENGLVTLQFEVEDTGPGIAQRDLTAIFEPFVQASLGRQTAEGTGLGLAITREYVRLMGGDIRVSSALGLGSLFQFEIRVEVVSAAEVQPASPARRVVGIERGQGARHGEPYRFLIAEDDEPGRRLLVRLFEPLGVDIREASDGREAIAQWQSWQPDLIWMDMQMPKMDGHEATQQIRSAGDTSTVIVAISASAFDQDRERVLAEGCDDFVRKPFRAEELYEMLSKHLGVRFVYEDVAPLVASIGPSDGEPTVRAPALSDLSGLPAALVTELRKATILADTRRLLSAIDQVSRLDPALAEDLRSRARRFDYRSILAMIDGAGVK